MKPRFLTVFAFLVVDIALTVPGFAACPESLAWHVPYSYGGKTIVSDFVLETPITRINIPWQQLNFVEGTPEKALHDVLSMVYSNSKNVGMPVSSEIIERFGSMEKFVEAFRSSVANAGKIDILAVLPAPGSEADASIRFLVKGQKESGYRLFYFRLVDNKYVYADLPLDPITTLEISVFRAGLRVRTPVDRVSNVAEFGFASANPCSPTIHAVVKKVNGPFTAKSTGVGALDFLSGCLETLESNRIDAFWSCFEPARARKLRDMSLTIAPDKRSRLLRNQFGIGDRALLLQGGRLTIVFFRRPDRGPNQTLSHINIVHTSSSSFEIVDDLTSGVLDSAVANSVFLSQVSKMIQ